MGNRGHWGNICKHCGQNISMEWIKEKQKQRGRNVSAGLAKAKAEGKAIGRPKKRDDKVIRELRKKGFSLRGIAAALKCSFGSVQAALKQKDIP